MTSTPAAPFTTTQLTVRSLCGSNRHWVLPWSQRSYAWGPEQMEQLVADILNRCQAEPPPPYYSLGHISVATAPAGSASQLIDGNQRITSIMILLAVIRDLETDPDERARLTALIWRATALGEPAPRLLIHPNAASFFAGTVLMECATSTPVEETPDLLETERRILRNRDTAVKRLSLLPPRTLRSFADYLLDACWLVVVSVATVDEAWEMVRSEETRGLAHHESELLRVRVIAAMPRDEQEQATRVWHSCRERIGEDAMGDLIRLVRLLEPTVPALMTKPLDVEIIDLFDLSRAGLAFMEQKVLPRADLLARLLQRDIDAGNLTDRLRRSLLTIGWLQNPVWWAPAIRWIETRGVHDPETIDFFRALDRTAWLNRLGAPDPTNLVRRAAAISREIATGAKVADLLSLDISSKLEAEALNTLSSRTFEEKSVCQIVLRRLSFELAKREAPERADDDCDPGAVDGVTVTIEHILPRSKPLPGTQWATHFRNMDGMREDAYRLGNLAFLTLRENQLANNRDYAEKRTILAGSVHILAREASREKIWTRSIIRDRGQRLIDRLWQTWGLA